jgi:hypothetical protein
MEKIKKYLSIYKYELLLIIISLFLIKSMNYLLQLDIQSIIYLDSGSYYEAAENIYHYYRGHNLRPMILAIIHGIPFLFTDSAMEVYSNTYYINLFCWIGSTILIYTITKHYISDKKAFFFSLLNLIVIGNIISVFHMLSETIFIFFISLAFYFYHLFKTKSKALYFSLFLSLVVISILIRPGAKFFGIFVLLFSIKDIIQFYKSKSFYLLYFSFFLIFIQCAGIKYQFGNFTVSYIDSVTYYNYLGSKAMSYKNNVEFSQSNNPRGEYLFSLDYSESKDEVFRDMKDQLSSNKLNLLKAYFDNLYENSTTGNIMINDVVNIKNTSYFEKLKSNLYQFSVYSNSVLTLIGLVLSTLCLLMFYKDKVIFITSIFILYTFLTSGVSSEQGDRFHLVFFPFIILLFAKLLNSFSSSKRVIN